MRHQHLRYRLNRSSSHRLALMRNMAIALFRYERIETTDAKAKALRPFAERLITFAKKGDLHSRRQAARLVHDHEILRKLFDELAERYRARAGGYTRVLKVGVRRGDAAPMSLIELVDAKLKAEPVETDTAKSAKSAETKSAKKDESKSAEAKAAKDSSRKTAKPRAESKTASKALDKGKSKKTTAMPRARGRKSDG